jgi:hypothetical protein
VLKEKPTKPNQTKLEPRLMVKNQKTRKSKNKQPALMTRKNQQTGTQENDLNDVSPFSL